VLIRGEFVFQDFGSEVQTSDLVSMLMLFKGDFVFRISKSESMNDGLQDSSLSLGFEQKNSDEERVSQEELLNEVRKLQLQLANLGNIETRNLKEIGREGNFIAYDDGTVLDTENKLMWWSETIEKGSGRSGAQFKINTFRGGGYSDWRLPSIEELKTIYAGNSQNTYKIIDLITLLTSHLISSELGDGLVTWGEMSIKVFNFKNGREEAAYLANEFKQSAYSLLPVRNAN